MGVLVDELGVKLDFQSQLALLYTRFRARQHAHTMYTSTYTYTKYAHDAAIVK
jgi:hypothetical protein